VTQFAVFLLTQTKRRGPVGDLARFASKSPTFPRHYARLYRLLEWVGDDVLLRSAMKQAHSEWRATKRQVEIP